MYIAKKQGVPAFGGVLPVSFSPAGELRPGLHGRNCACGAQNNLLPGLAQVVHQTFGFSYSIPIQVVVAPYQPAVNIEVEPLQIKRKAHYGFQGDDLKG